MENIPSPKLLSPKQKPGKIQIILPPPKRTVAVGASKPDTESTTRSDGTRKRREPKFVPHEPYKAAVQSGASRDASPQNADLAREPAPTKTCAPKTEKISAKSPEPNIAFVTPLILTKLNSEMTTKIEEKQEVESSDLTQLRKELEQTQRENAALKEQMNQQSKVNTELKKLLVASVGEDLETKLHFLTHDKVKLAHDVNHYVQRLLADYEELEKLSIQCDVWRSKFLASSLIVDELANWKAVLYHRYDDAITALQTLLNEHSQLHDLLKASVRNLKAIEDTYDLPSSDPLPSPKSVLELAENTIKMSSSLRKRFAGSSESYSTLLCPDPLPTNGEKHAKQVLANLSYDPPSECRCSNVGSGSLRKNVIHRFHPNTRYEHLTMNCCSQCQGDIKLL